LSNDNPKGLNALRLTQVIATKFQQTRGGFLGGKTAQSVGFELLLDLFEGEGVGGRGQRLV
jgi:hypothetical protein